MPPSPHPPYYNQQTIASKRKTGFHVSHTEGMSRLDHELEQFSDRLAPTDVEHNAKGVAMNEIERVLGTAYPGASVMAYGSYGERLYLPQNTLNLHALLPDTDFNDGIAWAVVELLRDEYRLATHAEVVGEFAVQLTIANANINIILTIGIEPPNSESFIWESDLVQFIHE